MIEDVFGKDEGTDIIDKNLENFLPPKIFARRRTIMNKLIRNLIIIAVILIIILLAGPFYVLKEGEQAVVTRFGAITSSTAEAGLKVKMPIADNVVVYPKKLLSWDGDAQRILPLRISLSG